MSRYYPDTVNIKRPTTIKDSGGSPTTTYADYITMSCRVQPIGSNENVRAGRQATTEAFNVYMSDYTSDINSKDIVIWDSETYDIESKQVYPNTYLKLVIVQSKGAT